MSLKAWTSLTVVYAASVSAKCELLCGMQDPSLKRVRQCRHVAKGNRRRECSLSRVFAGEDAVAEGESQGCLAEGRERVVSEFEREDGLDVLWLLSYDCLRHVSLR